MDLLVVIQRLEHWAIERLIPFVGNARTHSQEQIDQLAASIEEFGFVSPILVGPDGVIIAGHARLRAAQQLGMVEVPVIVLGHLSETQRRALVIADNALALNAGWDEELLRQELLSLQSEDFDLSLVGLDEPELTRLLAAADVAGLTDEDSIPKIFDVPITRPGDLWDLGQHRLLCGDATSSADLDRLLAGETVDLIFTDPPYNINYRGRTEDHLQIQGDSMSGEQFQEFLATTFRNCRRIIKPSASLYVCHSWLWQREFQNALEAAGFAVRCQLIWAKGAFSRGFGRYRFQHEPIFYCHVADQVDRWYGNRAQSTLWEEAKPAANREHPMAKPVALAERALVNSSQRDDVVGDLFGGSGSTLIACERRGRKGRVLEIDPVYADVIVRRWQEFTGQQARLRESRLSFAEVAQDRSQRAGGHVGDRV